MALNSRDLWVVLKAKDQATHALNSFSRAVRNAGNSVRIAQLEAGAATLRRNAELLRTNSAQAQNIQGIQRHIAGLDQEARALRVQAAYVREHHDALARDNALTDQQSGALRREITELNNRANVLSKTSSAQRANMAQEKMALGQRVQALQATARAYDFEAEKLKAADAAMAMHSQRLQQLSMRMQAMSQTAFAAGFALSVFGIAGIVGIKRALDVTIEYERQTRLTATQVRNFTADVKDLSDMGLRVARTIAVPFEEVQTALYDIFSSLEVGTKEAEQLLVSFSKAAVAGQVDIQSVSRGTIGILNAFQRPISDVNHLLDIQFQLVRTGIGTYEEWTNRIGLVTPSAVRAGQSIEMMAAALSTATRMGLPTANAGAAVARAFDAMSHPKTAIELKKIGVSVFDAAGKFRPMNDVLRELRARLMGLPEQERIAKLVDIFKGAGGTIQARRFLQAILLVQGNLELFDDILGQMEHSTGSFEQSYDMMANTTAAKTQLLSNRWKALQQALGEALIPTLLKLLNPLSRLLDWFSKLPGPTKTLIANVVLVTVALTTLTGVFLGVVGVIGAFVAAFTFAGTAILVTFGILFGGVAIIGGLIASLVLAYKHSEAFRETIAQVGERMKILKDIALGLGSSIRASWNKYIGPPLNELWNVIESKVIPAFNKFSVQVTTEIMPKIQEAARIIADLGDKAFRRIGEIIETVVVPAISHMADWWAKNGEELKPVLTIFGQIVKWALIIGAVFVAVFASALVGTVIAAIGLFIASLVSMIAMFIMVKKVFGVGLDWLKRTWDTVWGAIKDFFITVWGAIVNFFVAVWEGIKGAISAGLNWINGVWQSFWAMFGGLFKAIWNLIKAIADFGMSLLLFVIEWGLLGLQHLWGQVWGAIVREVKANWENIMNFLKTVWGVISSIAAQIWGTIVNRFNSIKTSTAVIWGAIVAIISDSWNRFYSIVSTQVSKVWGVVTGVWDKIKGFFSGSGSWLYDAGKNIIQGLINGITSMINKVTDAIKNTTQKIKDHLPLSPAKIGPLSGSGDPHKSGARIASMLAGGMMSKLHEVAASSSRLAQMTTPPAPPTMGGYGAGPWYGAQSGKTVNNTFHITTNDPDPKTLGAKLGWELQARI